jgi:hypothetical protein
MYKNLLKYAMWLANDHLTLVFYIWFKQGDISRALNMSNNKADYIRNTHAPVHVTDFPIVNVHVDELSSARIWQHKFVCDINIAKEWRHVRIRNINYNLYKTMTPLISMWAEMQITSLRREGLKYFFFTCTGVTKDLSCRVIPLFSTCAGACDWLSHRKCTCWWIIVCSNLAA